MVVTFEEGDPDQPLIIGSVYNAENMPWFRLPINKNLAGFKSASAQGTAGKNFNGFVFNDEKDHEHLAIHSENNLTMNSEKDKMIHAGRHKGERVAVANVFTVGTLIPGGGSGGAGYNQGNPIPEPPPTGIWGINSQGRLRRQHASCMSPLNHQLAFGSNLQMCINPYGLIAGMDGLKFPKSFKRSWAPEWVEACSSLSEPMRSLPSDKPTKTIGPPKIEIHNGYDGHAMIITVCAVLGAAAAAFFIAYDHFLPHQYKPNPLDNAADPASEQPGDRDRAKTALIYQATVDVLLMLLLAVESLKDKVDWASDDMLKTLYKVDNDVLGIYDPKSLKKKEASVGTSWWNDIAAFFIGGLRSGLSCRGRNRV